MVQIYNLKKTLTGGWNILSYTEEMDLETGAIEEEELKEFEIVPV